MSSRHLLGLSLVPGGSAGRIRATTNHNFRAVHSALRNQRLQALQASGHIPEVSPSNASPSADPLVQNVHAGGELIEMSFFNSASDIPDATQPRDPVVIQQIADGTSGLDHNTDSLVALLRDNRYKAPTVAPSAASSSKADSIALPPSI
jgi:hypothetical protein